jgi:hypothetical protein
MNLSQSEVEYFSDQENWSRGPMYDTWLYFPVGTDLSQIESVIIKAGDLTVWNGVDHPRLLKTIMPVDGLPSVGLVHCTHKPGRLKYPAYSVAIYPPQYERALGQPIDGGTGPLFERWHEMDSERVRKFHEALFRFVDNVAAKIPLVCASINTEDRPFGAAFAIDGSICVSPNVAAILGLVSKPTAVNSYGFFVSVSR